MTPPLLRYRILVAEDERHVRMLLRVVLEAAGATVIEAEDGGRAIRLLQLEDQGFHVVLTDLHMPECTGYELIDAVASRWPQLPIVVCSARGEAESQVLEGRVTAIVNKPFVPADLVRAVAEAAHPDPRLRPVAS